MRFTRQINVPYVKTAIFPPSNLEVAGIRNSLSMQKTSPDQSPSFFLRFKAFVIDLFMIYMPILYVTTYLILGGKEEFQNNQWAISGCILLYGVIDSLFCSIASQTPGMRAQNLIIQTKRHSKPSFFLALLRFYIWLFSLGFVFGLFFPFFRKDRRAFHDLICQTETKKTP